MKEEWAKRLDERLAGFERPVDDSLWAGIARQTASGHRRRWLVVAAALAVAASVSALIFVSRGKSGSVPAELPHPVEEVLVTDMIPSPPSSVETGTKTMIKSTVKTTATAMNGLSAQVSEKQPKEIVESQDMPTMEADTTEAASAKNAPLKDRSCPEMLSKSAPGESASVSFIEGAASKHRRLAVATSVYAQTSPWGGRFPRDGQGQQVPDTPVTPGPDEPQDGELINTDPPEEDDDSAPPVAPRRRAASEPAAGESTLTHSFPVQVGARVSFSWGTRWSVESGLTYMHFKSQGEYTKQNMEYFGIPLYLNCSFVSTRYFSLYGSVGGQALKCIAGNSPDKPWLFSTGMGIGAEYKFTERVSVYAEPGLDYYFHTGESRNYYTENPFAFSVSAGIRFHLSAK